MVETANSAPIVFSFGLTRSPDFVPTCLTALRVADRPRLIGLTGTDYGRGTGLNGVWEDQVQKRFPEAPLLVLHGLQEDWASTVKDVLDLGCVHDPACPTVVLLGLEGLEPEERRSRRDLERLASEYPYVQFLAYRPDWAAHPPRIR